MCQPANATVVSIAQSLGISHLKESIVSQLANDAISEILEVVGDSLQLMATTRCSRLRPMHINNSLESKDKEPLYGYSKSPELVKAACVDALDLLIYRDRQLPLEGSLRLDPVYPLEHTFECEWVSVAGVPLVDTEEEEAYEPRIEKMDARKGLYNSQIQRMDGEIILSSSKHVSSGEMQLYYQTTRKYLQGNDIAKRHQILTELKRRPCLGLLLPYYLQFCLTLVIREKNDFDKLHVALATARALAQNEDLNIEMYLQRFMKLTMSMLLSSGIAPPILSDQFMLRAYAADLLRLLVDKSLVNYPNVEPTVTNQMLSALTERSAPLAEKYGAVVGLTALGLETISQFLQQAVPVVVGDVLTTARAVTTGGEGFEMASRVYEAIVEAVGLCVHNDTYLMTAMGRICYSARSRPNYRKVMDTLGADLLPYYIDESALMGL